MTVCACNLIVHSRLLIFGGEGKKVELFLEREVGAALGFLFFELRVLKGES